MKHFFILLTLIGITLPVLTHAEKSDQRSPVLIESNKMEYDENKQISTFTGNVTITQGSLYLQADKVVITKDSAGYQFAQLFGNINRPALFKQKRDGGSDLWVEGQAERIEYNNKQDLVQLFSKALLKRLDNTKIIDQIEGDFISYNQRTEFISVHNNQNKNRSDTNRVKVVIQPITP